MGYGSPSFLAVHLLGEAGARSVRRVRSESVLYGSTAGPFGGIGGAAMSWFQMTALTLGSDDTLIFADERLLGWFAPGTFEVDQPLDMTARTEGLRSPETCPYPGPQQPAGESRT